MDSDISVQGGMNAIPGVVAILGGRIAILGGLFTTPHYFGDGLSLSSGLSLTVDVRVFKLKPTVSRNC